MRAVFAVIVLAITALVAGAIGFQAGVASNIGHAGGAVYLGWGAGFPFFGFLFFLLFVGFLVFAIGGRRRGGWGPYGGYGRMGAGPWGGDDADPRRQWIADAHRRLHEDEAKAAGSAPTAPGSASPVDAGRPNAG